MENFRNINKNIMELEENKTKQLRTIRFRMQEDNVYLMQF